MDKFDKILKENMDIEAVRSADLETEKVYIITAYRPSLDKFESDFKTRRR